MKGQKVLFSSGNDSWSTPLHIFEDLDSEFNFDFDPCPLNTNPKLTGTLFDTDEEPKPFDGLIADWGESNFVNPPYSNISAWMEKAYTEHKKGKTIVMLVPARTDTRWFHKYCLPEAKEIRFCKGRLKFGFSKNSAPFPSMIIIF
jgi:site-specific DNA-methyltransferase (adenine-specific)